MKLKNRINVFILICSLLVGVGTKAQEVQEELGDFSEVKTFNGVEVLVIPSTQNRIEISGHSKNDVKFQIVDNRLELRLSLDNIWSKDNTRIRVYGRSIETIDANEGSQVEVQDQLKGSELTFRVQEGASISAEVNSSNITSKAVTGGKITLNGNAERQQVDINTGGMFYGRGLKTKESVVSSGTAGKGEIHASQYVKATAKFGGTIEIFGRPKEVDHKTSMGGRIF